MKLKMIMSSKTKLRLTGAAIALAALWLAEGARAEVHSYTLGIDVNCPSGLGE
jgi:hypothetical protein